MKLLSLPSGLAKVPSIWGLKYCPSEYFKNLRAKFMDVLKRRPVITDKNPHVEGLQVLHTYILLYHKMTIIEYLTTTYHVEALIIINK